MKILFDTSIIVEIDRHNEKVVNLLKKLVEDKHELIISTITVSEILTGTYLRKDIKESNLKAKEVLDQFIWKDLDGEIAEILAKLLSYIIIENRSVEYPDIIIAATFISSNCDFLITLNKKDFLVFPQLKEKVFDVNEFEANLSKI